MGTRSAPARASRVFASQRSYRGPAPAEAAKRSRANSREHHRPCSIVALLFRQHHAPDSHGAPAFALVPKQGTARSARRPHSSSKGQPSGAPRAASCRHPPGVFVRPATLPSRECRRGFQHSGAEAVAPPGPGRHAREPSLRYKRFRGSRSLPRYDRRSAVQSPRGRDGRSLRGRGGVGITFSSSSPTSSGPSGGSADEVTRCAIGDPVFLRLRAGHPRNWIPAFAGMTKRGTPP
jgi:hypothetical protein